MLQEISASEQALTWLRKNELSSGGIRLHSQHACPYPEVTGYLIPTIRAAGDNELAVRLTQWEISIQREDGSYGGHDPAEPSYIFDTGQVLRGLLACMDVVPSACRAAQKSAEYLYTQLKDGGRDGFPERYAGLIPETVQLYALPPLIEAAQAMNRPDYSVAARRCLIHYLTHHELLAPETLTHFLGYELEALIDLGQPDLAVPILDSLRARQAMDGSVPAHPGVEWVCTPGVAQIAVCWYKVGWYESAERAMRWLEEHQTATGGFLGSYGPGADYFPNSEIPWAAKYYLDACQLARRTYRERQA